MQALLRVGSADSGATSEKDVYYLVDVEGRRASQPQVVISFGRGLLATLLRSCPHVLVVKVFDCFAKTYDHFKDISERDDAREAASVRCVPDQRKGRGLLNDHRFNALLKGELVVQHDNLRVVWQRVNYFVP